MENKENDGQRMKVLVGGLGGPFFTRRDRPPIYDKGKSPSSVRKARVDILDLSVATDYKYYLAIWDAVGYGMATVVVDDHQWMPEKNNWKVFIRWFFVAYMDPEELTTERRAVAESLISAQTTRE